MRIVACALLLSLTGCAAQKSTVFFPDHPQWFSYSAAYRAGFLLPKDERGFAKHMICAEPAPDIALSPTISAAMKGGYGQVSAEAQMAYNTKVIELAQRSETIAFLRENMYRLCEAYINGAILRRDALRMYQAVLLTAAKLAEAHEQAMHADASRSAADAVDTLSNAAIPDSTKQRAINTVIDNLPPSSTVDVPRAVEGILSAPTLAE